MKTRRHAPLTNIVSAHPTYPIIPHHIQHAYALSTYTWYTIRAPLSTAISNDVTVRHISHMSDRQSKRMRNPVRHCQHSLPSYDRQGTTSGFRFKIKTVFPCIESFIIKIRRSWVRISTSMKIQQHNTSSFVVYVYRFGLKNRQNSTACLVWHFNQLNHTIDINLLCSCLG